MGHRFGHEQEKMLIREMKREDVEPIVPIAATDPFNPWTKEMFLGEWLIPTSYRFLLCRVLEDGEEILLGYLCFRVFEEESELLHIAIAPEHRQKGFGKRLMEFYIDFCKRKGVTKYYLEVHPDNTSALRLYRGFQYQEAGRRKKFYREADALLLER